MQRNGSFKNIDRRVGDFWLEAHLASGGMADVFLASRPGGGGPLLVLKILLARYAGDEGMLAMFRDEARLLERLRHPNLVQYFGSGSVDGRPFLTLEYLDGDALSMLVRQVQKAGQQLPLSAVVRMGLQLANVLEYIHRATDEAGRPLGIVHRDISPQNVFLTYDGRIKLLDFGIAVSREREAKTRTGTIKGKIFYLSPEQIQADELDGRSDLFSLGTVLWELCTGERLFQADSDYQVMKRICELDIPEPASRRPEIPPELNALIMSLLERDRQKRLATAAKLRDGLSRLLFEQLPESPPQELQLVAEEFLGERRQIKQQLIAGARRRASLEAFLFSDLDITDPDVGPDDRQYVFQAATSLPPQAGCPPPAQTPGPAAPAVAERKLPWMALAAVVLLVLGLILLLVGGKKSPPPPQPALAGSAEAAGERAPPSPAPAVPVESAPEKPAAATEPPAAPERTLVGPEPAPPASGQPPAVTEPKPAETPPAAGPGPATAAEEDVGYLRLLSSPELEVYLDGELVGRTPVEDMPLKPGRYRLRVINREAHIDEILSFTIRKGEITAQRLIYH